MNETSARRLVEARRLRELGAVADARAAYRAICADAPTTIDAWLELARLERAAGDLPAAKASLTTALMHAPADARLHVELGACAQLGGAPDAAARHYLKALSVAPDYAPALQSLGDLARAAGHYAEAERCYRRLVRVEETPDNLVRLGAARQLTGDYRGARAAYDRALAADPSRLDARINLAICWQVEGDLDRAEKSLRDALAIEPGHAQATIALASVLDRRGDPEAGLNLLAPLIGGARADANLWVTYGRAALHASRARETVDTVECALANQAFSPADRSRIAFVAGAMRDQLGDNAKAIAHFRLANRMRPSRYSRSAFEAEVDAMLAAYPQRLADEGGGSPDERPVFVIGMPRSGSTLLEQVLAAHPAIATIGENPLLGRVAGPWLAARRLGLKPGPQDAGWRHYLDALPAGFERVVDKTLSHYLLLGLIAEWFPAARIVETVRHPLDIALSCYAQDFAGFELGFAYDLDDIVHYYRQYRRAMAHFTGAVGIDVETVHYEALVEQPERHVRRILEGLGVGFDKACLNFHTQGRVPATASYAQVRRPFHRDAVGRHRNYRQALAPVAAALRDEIDAYETTLDRACGDTDRL